MKKKWTALLLTCAMVVPYGAMPAYAEALNGAEAGETESYEAQTYGIESYGTESTETENNTEQPIQDEYGYDVQTEQDASDEYGVQVEQAKKGGNINWNYPDNIIPTDKTAASEGCLLAGVKGTYLADAQNALDLINQYRKEACDNGYPDPRDANRKLTSSDYKPIKWSSDLEYIARIRAAEASVLISHTRPNGESCFSLSSPNGIESYGEVLAWNNTDSMLTGIDQWYGEKQDWLDQDSSAETGHYTQMIDPNNNYVAIASFLNNDGKYSNATSGEFTSEENLDEETAPAIKDCIQIIEFRQEDVAISADGLDSTLEVGETGQAILKLSYDSCELQGSVRGWSSDDEDVVKVTQDGTFTAVHLGRAVITAEMDCGVNVPFEINVCEKGKKIGRSNVMITNYEYTGSAVIPSVTVKRDSKVLKEGTDYTCTYTKATEVGEKMTVTVKGIGAYVGTVTETLIVQARNLDKSAEISMGKCDDYTDFDSISNAIVVRCNGRTLVKNKDYYVSSLSLYGYGNVIEINAAVEGLGNYCGTVQKEFTVTKDQKPLVYSVSAKCTADGLNISWQSTDNADGYYIYRSCYRNNKWESWKNIKKITNGDTKTWKDNNTDSNLLYRYTVRAYNEFGMSDYNSSNITESYFVSKPITKLSNSAKGINVNWAKSKNASGYYIYRKDKKSDGWTKVKTVDSKTSSWMDNSAKSGKSYYYTVVAYRDKTRSAFDTDRTIVRLDMPSVKNSNAAKGVLVKWNKISGAQSYDVYRSQYANNAWTKWSKIASVSNSNISYTDSSVKEGTICKYTVRAVKGSSMSAYESGTAICYLSQPEFSLSETNKGIAVKMKANKNIDGYLIYRKDSNGRWQRMATVKANKDITWTDANVKKNSKYTYTVRAYKKNDLSSYHSGKSVTYKGGK